MLAINQTFHVAQLLETPEINATTTTTTSGGNGNGTASEYRLPVAAQITLFALHMAVILFILVTNLTVLGFIVKTRSCRKQGNIYIVSLTVANLFAGLISLPPAIMSDVTQVSHGIECEALHYCVLAADVAEVYTLVAIAYDRYHRVTSFRHVPPNEDFALTKFAVKLTLCIWAAAFLYSSKAFFLYELIDFYYADDGKWIKVSQCAIPRDRRAEKLVTSAIMVNFAVLFALPAILIVTFYALVYHRIKTSTLNVRARQRNQRVLRVLVGVVTVFILLTSPHEFLNVYLYLGPGAFPEELLYKEIFSLLSFSNFAVNSVVYVFFNDAFRRSFVKNCLRQNTVATATEGQMQQQTGASCTAF